MMYTTGRIDNDIKFVLCLRHATPPHYHHNAKLLKCWAYTVKDLEEYVTGFQVYSVESVSKM